MSSAPDIQASLENADEIARLTGRDKGDIIADLLDDGKLNNSNAIKENTSALDRATEMVGKTHKLLTALIPIMILLATSGLELGGIIDLTPAGEGDDWAWEDDEYVPPPKPKEEIIWGCMDDEAENYNPEATEDDGSCNYNEEPEPECKANFYDVYTEWVSETESNSLKVYWDADWSCDATQYIEVDIYMKWAENGTDFKFFTHGYNITYQQEDFKVATITDIPKGDSFNLHLDIWVDVNGWRKDAEILIEDEKSPQGE